MQQAPLVGFFITFFAVNAIADTLEATIDRLSIHPETGVLSVTLNTKAQQGVFPTTACGQTNQLAWTMENKGSDAVLSVLLSAYHTQSTVAFEYLTSKTCLDGRTQGGSVALIRQQ